MQYISAFWLFLFTAYIPGLIQSLLGWNLDEGFEKMGTAFIIFIIWIITAKYFTKQQRENLTTINSLNAQTLEAYTAKYEKTIREVAEAHNKTIEENGKENRVLMKEVANRYDELIRRQEVQSSEHFKNYHNFIERQFNLQDKNTQNQEAILGALIDMRSKINKE